jgi:hypothetical protein
MIYTVLAFEIARDRAREADRLTLARAAGNVRVHPSPTGGPRRPRRVRTLIARPVRSFSDASHALSEAACSAARRIEGPAG